MRLHSNLGPEHTWLVRICDCPREGNNLHLHICSTSSSRRSYPFLWVPKEPSKLCQVYSQVDCHSHLSQRHMVTFRFIILGSLTCCWPVHPEETANAIRLKTYDLTLVKRTQYTGKGRANSKEKGQACNTWTRRLPLKNKPERTLKKT